MLKMLQRKRPQADPERPKIHVTRLGKRYVKAGELLRSKRGRQVLAEMAELEFRPGPVTKPRNRDL